jgi:hypothetical protein
VLESCFAAVFAGGVFEAVACCQVSERLVLAEATFHAMALGIEMPVERIFESA